MTTFEWAIQGSRFSGSLGQIEQFLAQGSGNQRIEDWARAICQLSRELHIDCWTWQPPHDYVRDELIPILRRAVQVLEDLEKEKGLALLLHAFTRNIKFRANNIEHRYLRDLPSAIAPEDPLENPAPSPQLSREDLEGMGIPSEEIAFLLPE